MPARITPLTSYVVYSRAHLHQHHTEPYRPQRPSPSNAARQPSTYIPRAPSMVHQSDRQNQAQAGSAVLHNIASPPPLPPLPAPQAPDTSTHVGHRPIHTAKRPGLAKTNGTAAVASVKPAAASPNIPAPSFTSTTTARATDSLPTPLLPAVTAPRDSPYTALPTANATGSGPPAPAKKAHHHDAATTSLAPVTSNARAIPSAQPATVST